MTLNRNIVCFIILFECFVEEKNNPNNLNIWHIFIICTFSGERDTKDDEKVQEINTRTREDEEDYDPTGKYAENENHLL